MHYVRFILQTGIETVYSTWNDLQMSLKVIGNAILRWIVCTFVRDWKVRYTFLRTETAKMKVDDRRLIYNFISPNMLQHKVIGGGAI